MDCLASSLTQTDGHKGDFGRVLTVAGSTGMTGQRNGGAFESPRPGAACQTGLS